MAKPIKPASENQMADTVRAAAKDKTPLHIIGAGTKTFIGNKVSGQPVSTLGLSGITLYEPASLTLVVEAGTPFMEVEKQLAQNNQHLPFEPADYCTLLGTTGNQTVGGLVACAVSGPRRIQAGALRDSLIGVRFVNGEGDIIKSGGRVMKNVTGYDLVKLLAGSYGTLGVITQLSFKLLPTPEYTASINVHGLSDFQAVETLSAALGSPFDISGGAHFSDGENNPVTMIRLEGFEKSVKYRANKLKDLISALPYPAEIGLIAQDKAKDAWQIVRDIMPFSLKSGAVWRLSLKPSDAPQVVSEIQQQRQADAVYDWGGGLVWLLTPFDGECGLKTIRDIVNAVGGHATLIRQGPNVRNTDIFHPQPTGVKRLSEALRAQFDPHEILNPGILGG